MKHAPPTSKPKTAKGQRNTKLLTGQVIHREFLTLVVDRSSYAEWDGLRPEQRELYRKIANRLNVWLEQEPEQEAES